MTTFDKPALTFDKHLDTLRQRGLMIFDEALARYYLENIATTACQPIPGHRLIVGFNFRQVTCGSGFSRVCRDLSLSHKTSGVCASSTLVPKLQLGNPVLEAPASRSTRSWSFAHRIPKQELGNEQKTLSAYIQLHQPGIRGFSPQNIWRMRQFFEAYRHESKLSTLLREFPWSSIRNPITTRNYYASHRI